MAQKSRVVRQEKNDRDCNPSLNYVKHKTCTIDMRYTLHNLIATKALFAKNGAIMVTNKSTNVFTCTANSINRLDI